MAETDRSVYPGARVMQFSPHIDFPMFSKSRAKEIMETFKQFDEDGDGKLKVEELKKCLEALGSPVPHVTLKGQMKQAKEQLVEEKGEAAMELASPKNANLVTRIELFCLMAMNSVSDVEAGDENEENLLSMSGAFQLKSPRKNVDVTEVGVGGAKSFFENKAKEAAAGSEFEREIKEEQAARKKEAEEARKRKEEFKAKMQQFNK